MSLGNGALAGQGPAHEPGCGLGGADFHPKEQGASASRDERANAGNDQLLDENDQLLAFTVHCNPLSTECGFRGAIETIGRGFHHSSLSEYLRQDKSAVNTGRAADGRCFDRGGNREGTELGNHPRREFRGANSRRAGAARIDEPAGRFDNTGFIFRLESLA